jgi:hypothetical protein
MSVPTSEHQEDQSASWILAAHAAVHLQDSQTSSEAAGTAAHKGDGPDPQTAPLPLDVHFLLAAMLNACPRCRKGIALPTVALRCGGVESRRQRGPANDDDEMDDAVNDADSEEEEDNPYAVGCTPAWLQRKLQQDEEAERRRKLAALPEWSKKHVPLDEDPDGAAQATAEILAGYCVKVARLPATCEACSLAERWFEGEEALEQRGVTTCFSAQELEAALQDASMLLILPDKLRDGAAMIAKALELRVETNKLAAKSTQGITPRRAVMSIAFHGVQRPYNDFGYFRRAGQLNPDIRALVAQAARQTRRLHLHACEIDPYTFDMFTDPETCYNDRLVALTMDGNLYAKLPAPKTNENGDVIIPEGIFLTKRNVRECFPALSDISFSVHRDDRVGVGVSGWQGEQLENFSVPVQRVLDLAHVDLGLDQSETRRLRAAAEALPDLPLAERGLRTASYAVECPSFNLFTRLSVTQWTLHSLTIRNTEVGRSSFGSANDEAVRLLVGLPCLTTLSLVGFPEITGRGFSVLTQAGSLLESLEVGHECILSAQYIAPPRDTGAHRVDPVTGQILPPAPGPQAAQIPERGIDDVGCQWIARLQHLKSLIIHNPCDITDAGVTKLRWCSTLKHLAFRGQMGFTGAGFIAFAGDDEVDADPNAEPAPRTSLFGARKPRTVAKLEALEIIGSVFASSAPTASSPAVASSSSGTFAAGAAAAAKPAEIDGKLTDAIGAAVSTIASLRELTFGNANQLTVAAVSAALGTPDGMKQRRLERLTLRGPIRQLELSVFIFNAAANLKSSRKPQAMILPREVCVTANDWRRVPASQRADLVRTAQRVGGRIVIETDEGRREILRCS